MTSPEDQDPAPRLLATPSGGVPEVVDTVDALDQAVAALRAGSGPLAVDAERAQSFRYSAKAYLIQLRRAGAGTILIDPEAFEVNGQLADLSVIRDATADAEWLIHAATQDLACLVEIGLTPPLLFDTELAGRLLGFPKVGLSAMLEHYLGITLAKEHSAADWSKRPLPNSFLNYAALDVELLIPLRERIDKDLEAASKAEWAAQEFDYLVRTARPLEVDPQRWRRVKGAHTIRNRRGMAALHELWRARDDLAFENDLAPSKVLPDLVLSGIAATVHTTVMPSRDDLQHVEGIRRPQVRRYRNAWRDAVHRAVSMPESELPAMRERGPYSSNPRNWERNHPEAYARWQALRPATTQLAESLNLPAENLIAPALLRQLAWQPPQAPDQDAIAEMLTQLGSRPWQIERLAPVCAEALANAG